MSQTGVAALSAISDALSSSQADSVPDLQDLASILYFSAGTTKQRRSPGGEFYFRAAACTGALYTPTLHDPLLLPRTATQHSSFPRGDRAFKL